MILTCSLLVHSDKFLFCSHSFLGNDRYLDAEFWVSSPYIRWRDLSSSHHVRFHNVWEFWAYNVVFGLFQAPYYAFAQTMMAELSPPGFDNMVFLLFFSNLSIPSFLRVQLTFGRTQFFGLFGLSNRASSMIGPNVIQAIIDDTGNNWKGFPFLFAMCAAASLVIWICASPFFSLFKMTSLLSLSFSLCTRASEAILMYDFLCQSWMFRRADGTRLRGVRSIGRTQRRAYSVNTRRSRWIPRTTASKRS